MISIVKQHHEAKVSKWLLGRIEDAEKVKIIFIVDDDKDISAYVKGDNYTILTFPLLTDE